MSQYHLHNAMRRAAMEKLHLVRVSKEPQRLPKDFYDKPRHKNFKLESKERSLTVELEKVREESVVHLQVVQDLQNQLMDARTQLKREIKEKETLQVEFEGITKKNNTLTRQLETETVEVARLQFLDKVDQADIEDLRDVYDLKHRAAQQDEHELLLISDKDEEIQKRTYAGEEMSQTLHDLLKKEISLSEQNRDATNELARLQSLTAKQYEEKRNLKTAVQDLQYQMELANEQICQMDEQKAIQTRKMAYYEEQLDEYHILTTDLKQSVCDLKHQQEARQEEEIVAGADLQHQVREGQELIWDEDEEIQKLTCAVEELSQALHDLPKKEVSLSEQNRNATNELARLESLTAKQNEETRNLKTAVQDLQSQMELANEQIFQMDEHKAIQIGKIAYYQEQLEECYILTTDLKQSLYDLKHQQEEEILAGVDLQHQVREGQELIRDKDEEIQNLTCAGEEMSQALHDLQKKEVSLSKQNRNATNEVSQLESLNENLRKQVQELQKNGKITADENQSLIAKVACIESLRQAETEQLQRSEELIRDKDEEIQNLTCAGKKMSQALHDLQTKEVSLSEQNRNATDELARLESLTAKQNEETRNLKTAVQDLQSQVELANDQICQMDEHKAIQTRKIAYYQEQLEECYILTTDLKQSVRDLKHQQEARQEEEILAGVDLQHQVREGQELIWDEDEEIQKLTCAVKELSQALHDLPKKEVSLSEQNRNATNELARLESLTAKQNEETRNLKTAVQDLQSQMELANEQIFQMDEHKAIQTRKIAYYQEQLEECYSLTTDLRQSVRDLKHQQEARLEEEIVAGVGQQGDENFSETTSGYQSDESLPESPASVSRTRSFLCRSAKCLLKVGLPLAITAVGVGPGCNYLMDYTYYQLLPYANNFELPFM
ncbi:golgin subfamily A member 6-like protein 22 [Sebastes umbrosus]|uniref:golgin subfamily A member 6-like protein 22 n=1 Tax=Sebastes umbrosus TaxID=72105 RepID=UPI00189EDC25|nr:golgin subfamily A member 6-like protein 22 [Sebastes umbrosus]